MRRLGRSPQTTRRVLVLLALSPALFGGVLLTRFDLLPATVVAGATALLLAGRLRLAAGVLGAAVAIKLYPLVLLPLLAAWAWRRRGRREAAIAVGLVLGIATLAYLPFFVLSPGGVADSIGGQLGRPLQIESLGAGILFVAPQRRGAVARDGARPRLPQRRRRARRRVRRGVLAPPGRGARLAVGAVRPRQADGGATVRYAAAVLVAFIVLGKVLSPQFLVWLLFAVPLVAGRRGVSARRAVRRGCARDRDLVPGAVPGPAAGRAPGAVAARGAQGRGAGGCSRRAGLAGGGLTARRRARPRSPRLPRRRVAGDERRPRAGHRLSAVSKRTGTPVRMRAIASSASTPITESCGPVMPDVRHRRGAAGQDPRVGSSGRACACRSRRSRGRRASARARPSRSSPRRGRRRRRRASSPRLVDEIVDELPHAVRRLEEERAEHVDDARPACRRAPSTTSSPRPGIGRAKFAGRTTRSEPSR